LNPDLDDVLRTSKRARDEAYLAMLDAGLIPGTVVHAMESWDDVEAMYRLCAETDKPMVFYRIPRMVAEQGAIAGAVCASTLIGMPSNVHGKVILAFDGWNDDPRELFQVPEVVGFCRGMLFINPDQPSKEHAKRILTILCNEDEFAFEDGKLVEQQWLESAGGIWLCSVAFRDEVFVRSPQSKSGWLRDYGLAHATRLWLLGQGPPPK
jgi:hypothetical protein